MPDSWTEDDFRLRLHPLTTSANLIRASIVITSYELLKAEIVDHIRDFLARRWTADGTEESEEYRASIFSHGRKRVEGSLAWLQDRGVLSTSEVATVNRLRVERNRLAHELGSVVVDPGMEVDTSLIGDAVGVAQTLGRFWGSIAVDTDPAFDAEEVDYDGIRSGVSLLLEHLQAAAMLAETLAQLATKDVAGKSIGT